MDGQTDVKKGSKRLFFIGSFAESLGTASIVQAAQPMPAATVIPVAGRCEPGSAQGESGQEREVCHRLSIRSKYQVPEVCRKSAIEHCDRWK